MPFSVLTVGKMLRWAKDRKEIVSARKAANRGKDKRSKDLCVTSEKHAELNGMVECLNRALRDAFCSGDVGSYVSQAINELLKEFVRYDNEGRCNTAIGGATPFLR